MATLRVRFQYYEWQELAESASSRKQRQWQQWAIFGPFIQTRERLLSP
jgi:hypothetical protein